MDFWIEPEQMLHLLLHPNYLLVIAFGLEVKTKHLFISTISDRYGLSSNLAGINFLLDHRSFNASSEDLGQDILLTQCPPTPPGLQYTEYKVLFLGLLFLIVIGISGNSVGYCVNSSNLSNYKLDLDSDTHLHLCQDNQTPM